jgi:site-specific DNA recombinase
MTKRAILYARVSGDDRKYATSGIESQLNDCRKYADERGYKIVGEVYETPDKVTSGADWLPELDRVLKLAQSDGFDVLVVREIDRLARNRFKQMSVEIQLESCGARVEYVIGQFEESAKGRLLKGLMSEFAEYEREKIRQRTARGIVRSVEAGNVKLSGFGAPYGYTLGTKDGKRVLIVNEQEAAIVRLVFDMYVNQRLGMFTIAEYLSERQVPAPKRSSAWQESVVGLILANETYTGRWYDGKI